MYENGRSTTDDYLLAVDTLTRALDEPKVNTVLMTFPDLSKVFDRIDKISTNRNVGYSGVSKHLVLIVHSFLSQQQQKVKLACT